VTAVSPVASAAAAQDFSLVLGGPLYQLFRRSHLAGDALELARRRLVTIAAVAWLPLLVLSAMEGRAWTSTDAVPFLRDVEANVRFLVALPLLVAAELIVHQRMRPVVGEFIARHLVPDAERGRFDRAVASAYAMRNSVLAEILLIAVVYGAGIMVLWRNYVALPTATWYAAPGSSGTALTMTGRWYVYVSVPIFQFLLLRWYYRMFVWARFLWQVSRIPLRLVPTHPDRVGGLGFLSNIVYAFAPLAVAHGALLAGVIGNRIFYTGASLPDFKVEIVFLLGFLAVVLFAPFLAFGPQLALAKRTGLREYGGFAERYVREFDTKWLRGGAPPDEPLVGSGDIQSLADLGNSFEVVKEMRFAPITRDALIRLALATLAPIAPLGLTMMSAEDLLKKLFGMLF
jgi:hypothetical protein